MNIGKEAIEALAMGIAIILFGAVVFLVVANVKYGQFVLSSSSDEIETIGFETEEENFQPFTEDEDVEIPAVAAYALIGYNQSRIDEIQCEICGTTYNFTDMGDLCLRKHLNGFVKVHATMEFSTRQYTLEIKEVAE